LKMSYDLGKQSAMKRLQKAAALGFGPLAEKEVTELPPARPQEKSPSPEAKWKPNWKLRPDPRVLRSSGSAEDKSDVAGFLAPKGPTAKVSTSNHQVPGAPKVVLQTLNISMNTSMRATAASAGARPKSAIKAPQSVQAAKELEQRQMDEKAAQEFEQMQREAKRRVMPDTSADEGRQSSPEPPDTESLERKKEERRRKDKWRKLRKEERRQEEWQRKQQRKREVEDILYEEQREERAERNDAAARANMWRLLNNDGRIHPKGLGQVSDRDLDQRLQGHAVGGAGRRFPSESEAVTKLKFGIPKTGGLARALGMLRPSRSRSRDRGRHR